MAFGRRRFGPVLAAAVVLTASLPLRAAPDAAATPAGSPPTREQLDFFEAKVRPVLVEHCYKCHSAKAEKLKGGLYVDARDGLLRGGDSGPSVVPGEPDKSRLIESVRYGNEDTAMPPKGKLPDAAVRDLEAWVKMGAPWPAEAATTVAQKGPDYEKLKREHWAYQPITRPVVPAVRDAGWAAGNVDRFVLAAAEAKGVKPVGDADRATLLRRVYFDLTGLPPTPAQIDAFVADAAPDSFEQVVDRLLASPQFGERWGRHWLDLARYAESVTLRGLVLKDAWRYRDYVIEAFNADRPFDAFLQEQVAGDLLPADTIEQRRRQMTGTTFLGLGNTNLEEQDKKQLRMDVVDEQLDTLGKAVLGQTLGCARCHDHKFDPIPAKDYYALAGILRNAKTLEHANVSKWLEVPLPEAGDREAVLKQHEAAVAALQARITDAKAEVAKAAAAAVGMPPEVEVATTAKAGKGPLVRPTDFAGVVVDNEQARKVGEWKVSSHTPGYIGDGYANDLNAGKGEKTITFQPEPLAPGRYEVRFAYTAGPNRATNVPVTVFSADGEKTVEVNEQVPPPIDGHFVSLGQHLFERNGAGFVLVSNEGTNGYVLADAVQFVPVEQVAGVPGDLGSAKRQAGGGAVGKDEPPLAAGQRPARPAAASADAVAASADAPAVRLRKLEAELKKLQAEGPKRETVISVAEEQKIEDAHVHVRGSVHNLGPVVPRGFMSAVEVKGVPTPPPDQSGRRELGLWLAAKDNPLPARVMSNRVWHWLMGQGIVRTVDNFGTTGETPSHPELLDYLATRFVGQDWSVKKLVREVVLSRTYRLAFDQGSTTARAAAAVDPENRLCWRANRQRLDGEAIRDAMLAVSGQLDPTAPSGPTYKPGINADYGYKHADVRRSVYVPLFRNSMPEIIEAFDAADPSVTTGRRNVSTVAPQALFMLNHPFVQEQATAAAARLLRERSGTASARVDAAYRSALGRPPTDAERELVLRHVAGSVGTGEQAEQDAWAEIFHALFASPEFRYVN